MSTIDPNLARAMAAYETRTPRSRALWDAARTVTPLGVHSNYRYLEPYPFYVHRANGVTLWDADGNAYLDFNMAFGCLQSGHAHPELVRALQRQLELGSVYGYEWEETPAVADRLCRRFDQEMVRFSSTGLEATHHAIRMARAFTGRRLVVKFEGCYHGSHDTLLVSVKPSLEAAGSPSSPTSVPAGPGIPADVPGTTVVAPFNDLEAVRALVAAHRDEIAAIIAEPFPMNMGFVVPDPEFFPGIRELCDETGALLVFDEIKTGAKFPRGATGRLGVRPDLLTLGKSIACGIPLSAIVGRRDVLERVGPRKVAHAGTYNSNPLGITACRASLDHILTEDALARSTALNAKLAEGYRSVFRDAHVTAEVAADGVSGTPYFTDHPVRDWRTFLTVDGERSMLYYYLSLNRGLIPAGTGPDEQWTISVQHTQHDVERHLETLSAIAGELRGGLRVGEIEESV